VNVTQQIVDGRPALRVERRYRHSVERVWRAVTEPAELARWFVAEAQWTPALDEEFPGGRITELDPPHRFAWIWGDQLFAFELTADGDGCRLVFTHVFDPDAGPPWQHAAGWETYFDRLEAHLDGGHLSEEDTHAGIEARMAAYRESFA
jgi:uncharacterized protein YndB with AHSA1/START domain